MTKTLVSLFLLFNIISYGQEVSKLELSKNNKIVFIGEGHRIKENHHLQFEIIKHLVNKEGYNTIILESATSFQYIIDRMVQFNDTTGVYRKLPKVICFNDSCNHQLYPVIDFLIQLTDFARSKNIDIICFDTEENYFDTQYVIERIIKDSGSSKIQKKFKEVLNASSQNEIKEEILELYKKKRKWFSRNHGYYANYLYNIIENIYLESKSNRAYRLREKYLFDRFNDLFKANKNRKVIAIYGQAHTHKVHCDSCKFSHVIPNQKSVAEILNSSNKSLLQGSVTSIAITYFFNQGSDKNFTFFGYFENDDLSYIREELAVSKYKLIKTRYSNLSKYIVSAYDYVFAINDCHKLLEHTRYYH